MCENRSEPKGENVATSKHISYPKKKQIYIIWQTKCQNMMFPLYLKN